ncbi:hypothetical protein LTR36_001026 [Oleoguttula mirabilis]|uniref:Uncharacterized protein n=1 Tax=Oleoguttula mirabilis TaxID=1507867 RepID=A0AAV9JQW5_9PEZI|nr:hypothetical protein LTR36_001026 [Oleoguttula mirabilis]
MPRAVAPPPSGEFTVRLTKPFSGPPKHTVEVIGEPNRSASVRVSQYNGHHKSTEKDGDMPHDDVQELLRLVSELRGFPSNHTDDVYGQDAKVEFDTFEIQWSNADDDPSAGSISELAFEQKDDFKRIVQSIEALGRAFAKRDVAI